MPAVFCRFFGFMEWLFSILQTLEKWIVIEEDDSYHRRIFGFISEFLLLVWVTCRKKKVYECMVGMLGEKAETAEIKHKLGEYFARGFGNVQGEYGQLLCIAARQGKLLSLVRKD